MIWASCVKCAPYLIFTLNLNVTCVIYFQVRETDESDPFREKTVQLLDDFKISGVNGTRILLDVLPEMVDNNGLEHVKASARNFHAS